MYDQAKMVAELRTMGANFNPTVMMQTRELFRSPLLEMEWSTQAPHADIAYGDHPRQVLDLYPTTRPDAPVLLFVHGGGFVAGDKSSDAVFYGNVARYFAHHGFLAAAMNYRLAPDFGWPAGSEDVSGALTWLEQHAAEYGGDSSRIVILGQSAGAAHTASVLFDDRFTAPESVRGAALLSGFYRAQEPLVGGPALYFGDQTNLWADRSPQTHVRRGHTPVLLGIAEFDPAVIAEQTFFLAEALNRVDGRPPRLHWFEDQNHVSSVHGLGLGDDTVGTLLRTYFDDVLADQEAVAAS